VTLSARRCAPRLLRLAAATPFGWGDATARADPRDAYLDGRVALEDLETENADRVADLIDVPDFDGVKGLQGPVTKSCSSSQNWSCCCGDAQTHRIARLRGCSLLVANFAHFEVPVAPGLRYATADGRVGDIWVWLRIWFQRSWASTRRQAHHPRLPPAGKFPRDGDQSSSRTYILPTYPGNYYLLTQRSAPVSGDRQTRPSQASTISRQMRHRPA